jgi:hypothetical protein
VSSTGLASIDISDGATRVTQRWVDRAGLRSQVLAYMDGCGLGILQRLA